MEISVIMLVKKLYYFQAKSLIIYTSKKGQKYDGN